MFMILSWTSEVEFIVLFIAIFALHMYKEPSLAHSPSVSKMRWGGFLLRYIEPHGDIPPCTQSVILSVPASSYDNDGTSWNESSNIGIMNESYSWLC